MADDQVDISGMPDPGTIGLDPAKQSDPTDGMPDPRTLFAKHYGYSPKSMNPSKEELDAFMANPPSNSSSPLDGTQPGNPALNLIPGGMPHTMASLAASTAGGVASAGAHLLGGLTSAALIPAGKDAVFANSDLWEDRAHRWAEKLSKLADYVPRSAVDQAAEAAMNLPVKAGGELAEGIVKPHVSENTYQTGKEATQDVLTDLQALPAAHLAKVGGAAALDAAARYHAGEPIIPKKAPKAAPAAEAAPKPDFSEPVSADSLRSAPNPIPPPEGTVAHAKAAATPSAAPEAPPAAPALGEQRTDMSLSPEARAAERARVAAARAQEEGLSGDLETDPVPAGAAAREGAAARRDAMTDEERAAYDQANRIPADNPVAAAQRGSVRLFNEPAKEGPQETPTPDKQGERAGHLDALDKLSRGGLPSRRTSALTGDYNATGDDFQMKEVGNEVMRKQIASENAALHKATDNVHGSIDSAFGNSVDSQTLGDRGRVTRGAIQAIEKHFDDATDAIYDTARAANQGRGIPKLQRVSDYLNDDSNFTNDAEIGLQRAAKQRMERLWTTGDPDKGAPPGSVNAAERLREFLNEKGKNPNAMGVAGDLKGHLDMDVAEHGGPGLFEAARAMRRHKFQMLEEPVGIKKLLAPADSQGINHAIPEHKVMDYIADLPREQHEHVLKVLRAGAHLDPEIAKSSAEAIREIQAHAVSRIHAAATNADGTWNARKFYNAADRYARNMPETFKDRPDILKHLKTINDAGNTLNMDKHYPGAGGQIERTGLATHAIEAAGSFASGLAHELPMGRIIGRGIEKGTEKLTGNLGAQARDKAVAQRLVDRNGKQRGSVQVMGDTPAARMKDEFDKTNPEEAPVGYLGKRVGKSTAELYTDPGDDRTVHLEKLAADEPGGGHGTAALKHITDLADKHGARVTLDAVPQGKNPISSDRLKAYYAKHGFEPDGNTENSMTREPKQGGSQLNIGLHQGNEGQPGFRKMSKQEATGAVESTGAKVTKSSVLTPEQHGVYEPTMVASTDRPLSEPEMQKVLAKTKQSAIPQRTERGDTSMHIAPGHEEIAKREGWDKFNPEYFREHDGTPMKVPSSQAGRVRVMNEKPLAGAPEGDKPNGKARAAAAAYAKSAGIDHQPLTEYRYVDPDVAKRVGDAYEAMKHDPTDPKVKKSYDAFKAETLAQYKQMVKAGVKVDLDPSYPYKNPREMHEDVRQNNHMSIYPTEEGFGSSDAAATSDHPLMEKAPVKMGGKDATYNDLFRAVHDYYGHAAEGNGFRANGEYNAWRAHRQMYSDAARGAMDAETLGQNSWVNSGPPAAFNKGASQADTIYADQKAGLLPKDVVKAAVEGVGADEHHVTNQLTDSERRQLRSDTTKRLIDAFHATPATEEYAAAALAGAAKRGWYRNSAQAIVNQFGHDAPRFAGLLSAMSPQVSVQTNFANALKTFVNWDKAGRPEDPADIRRIMEESSQKSAKAAPGSSNVLDAWVNNAVRALTSDDPTQIKLSGPKVHSFYNNLTDNVNEVTNDAWMSSFAKIDPAKLGGSLNKAGPGKSPSYMALSAKVRAAASMLSRITGETWTPAEVQETVWSWAKTAYEHAEEKGDRSIPELVNNGDITDDLIRSTPDFHQLFGTSEHRGLLQSSRFAGNADGVAGGKSEGAHAAGPSKASAAAQEALRPHLLSAAERLERVRQERRAAGKGAPKDDSEE